MSGRIRTIKPEWLEDELVGAASDAARVLSVALILLADDHGNGRAHLAYLASHAWPYGEPHEVLTKVAGALKELVGARFVELYDVGAQRYFHIRNWARHQKVQHPGSPRVPQFCESSRMSHEELTKVSAEPHEVLTPDLRSPISDHDQQTPATAGPGPDGPAVRSELRAQPASESAAVPVRHAPPVPAPLVLEPAEDPRSPVARVFAAHIEGWRSIDRKGGGRPPVLTDKRRKAIQAQLRHFPEADLCAAVRNVFRSEFHVDNGHTSIDLVLRDAAHVERFRDLQPGQGDRSPGASRPIRLAVAPEPGGASRILEFMDQARNATTEAP